MWRKTYATVRIVHGVPPRAPAPRGTNEVRKGRVLRCAEWCGHARTIVISALAFALVAIVVYDICAAFRAAGPVYVGAIDIPKSLAERGYTPAITAKRLADEIHKLQKESGTEKETVGLNPEREPIDFQVPGSGLSIAHISRYVGHVFKVEERRIHGEILQSSTGLVLRLRTTMAGVEPFADVRGTADDIDALLHAGARQVMGVFDPYVLAAYLSQPDRRTVPGNRDAAEKALQLCLRNALTSDDKWAYLRWSDILDEEGDTEAALERIERALRIDPDFLPARQVKATVLMHAGRTNEMRKEMQTIEDTGSRTPGVLAALGGFHAALGYVEKQQTPPGGSDATARAHFMKAAAYFQDAITTDRRHAGAYHNLGRVQFNLERYNEAITAFRDSRDRQGDNLWDLLLSGSAYLILNRIEEGNSALVHAERLARTASEKLALNLHWGHTLRQIGRHAEAAGRYERAADQAPDRTDILELSADALDAADRPDDAARMRARARAARPGGPS